MIIRSRREPSVAGARAPILDRSLLGTTAMLLLPLVLGLLLTRLGSVRAEDGSSAWLRYAPLPASANSSSGNSNSSSHAALPLSIAALNSSAASPVYTAGQELQKGISSILGKSLGLEFESDSLHSCSFSGKVVVGTVDEITRLCGRTTALGEAAAAAAAAGLGPDGFWLSTSDGAALIAGQNERSALYGAFEYLSLLAQGNFSRAAYATSPSAPIRWVNEWDNLDGGIERGYGGPSIFFRNGRVVDDLSRAAAYGRLLASVGINGVVVNNVNANATLLSTRNMDGLARIADVFRPYGVRLGISLNFASPTTVGGLATFDPLDTRVIAFWANITEQLYQRVPDLAGFLVKANSEGQPGPLTYNRTLAQGANLFARALQPHGGVLLFRAFVYNNHLNEADWTADRANAAVDFFRDLDGQFDDNVVIQVKYGPIDFQVREPASPLFAHLRHTSAAIELQVSQEYLGQQCHLVYLAPLWKTVLDFDLRVDGRASPVRDIVSGARFGRPLGGYAAVVNVGAGATWLGSHMALANLYAYGRLAWDPTANAEDLVRAWARLTFGPGDGDVVDTVAALAMQAWPAYENYTGNLGMQTLTDILYTHFGPNPASHDNNGWGQWTRADSVAIGMDRTVANGTGFAGQYPPEVARTYESSLTTPDQLLLWFHHVSYSHRLSTGQTVIQHIYDAHYSGAETAQRFVAMWRALAGKIDANRHGAVLVRLVYQAGHAIVWRDAVAGYFRTLSGIPDEAGRVGHHPWRVEAEDMALTGYRRYAVHPAETASGAFAVVTSSNATAGTAVTALAFPPGTYDIVVGYFDLARGRSHWELLINNRTVGRWIGDNEDTLGHAPSAYLDGHTATRVTFPGIHIDKGDELRIVGTPDGIEPAPLDYVAVLPPGVVD